jgi:tRNA G18 (ribose-2'-O)-methylase SpoU
MRPSEIRVVLHNIRSAHNVGSIFRTADAIGVSRVYLTGYTPLPVDRFGFPVKEIAKTALGAERHIPWEHHARASALLKRLSEDGNEIIGVEQDARAVDYRFYLPQRRKVVVVVGNEVRGLSPSLRARCDTLIEIPMRGKKESLNVSVAFGIAMFRMFDR